MATENKIKDIYNQLGKLADELEEVVNNLDEDEMEEYCDLEDILNDLQCAVVGRLGEFC